MQTSIYLQDSPQDDNDDNDNDAQIMSTRNPIAIENA